MTMVPPSQPRGVAGVNTGMVVGTGLDGAAAPGLSNLETIIAATVRAVTGQLSGMESSSDGGVLMRNANPSALPGMDMTGAGSGAFAMNRWSGPGALSADGVGGMWRSGTAGMPSADAVRSGLLSSDNDPSTLYVGNVSRNVLTMLYRVTTTATTTTTTVSYTHLTLPTILRV